MRLDAAALLFVAVIACVVFRLSRGTKTRRAYSLWYGSLGLLLPIPVGFSYLWLFR
jgi:hypothetical protein